MIVSDAEGCEHQDGVRSVANNVLSDDPRCPAPETIRGAHVVLPYALMTFARRYVRSAGCRRIRLQER